MAAGDLQPHGTLQRLPFCAGREVLAGFNDLASTHPALSAQWDWEKNFDLTPQMVMVGNSRKVWWRCEKGHSWQATIASRASGLRLPGLREPENPARLQ